MITLKEKIAQQRARNGKPENAKASKTSVRDKLLVKEVQEMEQNLPRTCSVHFSDPNVLHHFVLTICPDEGYWSGGTFRFDVNVPEGYNISPPSVRCMTRIWHPNITEDGAVCLSILRETSLDAMGWAPTRRLKDVAWGLCSLFSDLLNFEDPLNVEAAEHYDRDRSAFIEKVKSYIRKYALRSPVSSRSPTLN